MISIVISSGHGLHIRGARGNPVPPQLDEVDQARRVVDRVFELLKSISVPVKKFHDDTSTTQSQNLNTIVAYHNAQTRDLDVSVHFNAYDHSAHGTEVLYVTQKELASDVSAAICAAGGFTNRGAKKRTDLAFLNNTEEPAILIETCFCDNTGDSNQYNEHFEAICRAIAETISEETIAPPEPEPIPPEPEPVPPTEIPTVTITTVGAVRLVVNGIELAPPIALPEAWRENVTATVFGGGGDEQDSAYPDIDWIDEDSVGVALPYKWSGTRPTVLVRGPTGEATVPIIDLGPWNLNDSAYVLNGQRPKVEQQYKNQTVAENGQIPTNDAAIDLTPPVAEMIGVGGKGKVKWRFA